jgi:ADP-ribose diphosphatase
MAKKAARRVLGKGQYLQLVRKGKWEIAERINARGAVAIIAISDQQEYVLTDQYREAVGRHVIDLPAGLSGDVAGQEDEPAEVAARRELQEETGFLARKLRHIGDFSLSPGLTSEICSYFLAKGVTRVSSGGGVDHEKIEVLTPKLRSIKKWLTQQIAAGKLIDTKVYAGLHFIRDAMP